jgi:formylglycine-generating enzyme required for sulfatase activity
MPVKIFANYRRVDERAHRFRSTLLQALALMFALWPSLARAEARIALVITNQAYTQPGAQLSNTYHDGETVKAALEKVGFKVWVVKDTASEGALLQAVGEHVQRLAEAGPDAVGFLYYSGHGAADRPDGANYLIPTAAPLTHASQLPLMAVRLDRITQTLASTGRMSFVVFDACRNVPLQRETKDFSFKGFAPAREQNGLLVAFATEPGNVAVDQSVYARALAETLVAPGLEAGQVFRQVRLQVRAATGFAQSPEYLDKRERDFNFVQIAAKAEGAQMSEATREWSRLDRESVAELELFIRRHGASIEADYARARLHELRHQAPVVAARPPDPLVPVDQCREAAQVYVQNDDGWMYCFDYGVTREQIRAYFSDVYGYPPREPGSRPTPVRPVSAICNGVEIADGRRCVKAKDTFRDCPVCPEMVVIPAGEFMMGSDGTPNEEPVHKVRIAKNFAVGKFAVAFAEWDACVADGGCSHKPDDRGWGRDRRPVINISWDDATQQYLPWLSRKAGKTYRLLSEAEWEYAARAGLTTAYSWGNQIGKNNANCRGCGSQWENKQTAPVGSFKPNAFGLYDMHGNVSQLVEDCYLRNYTGAATDGSARSSPSCPEHVLRGGSWQADFTEVRSAARTRHNSFFRSISSGFRVARTL